MKKSANIDFTDIPELTAEDFKHAKKMGRPPKSLADKGIQISLRVPRHVLVLIRAKAALRHIPYQTLINEKLAKL